MNLFDILSFLGRLLVVTGLVVMIFVLIGMVLGIRLNFNRLEILSHPITTSEAMNFKTIAQTRKWNVLSNYFNDLLKKELSNDFISDEQLKILYNKQKIDDSSRANLVTKNFKLTYGIFKRLDSEIYFEIDEKIINRQKKLNVTDFCKLIDEDLSEIVADVKKQFEELSGELKETKDFLESEEFSKLSEKEKFNYLLSEKFQNFQKILVDESVVTLVASKREMLSGYQTYLLELFDWCLKNNRLNKIKILDYDTENVYTIFCDELGFSEKSVSNFAPVPIVKIGDQLFNKDDISTRKALEYLEYKNKS
jgi:hypothetical protein